MRYAVIAAACLALAGCASIITGTSQKISIATQPTGAKCVLSRQDQPIATIEPTPGAATVQKDKHDILVKRDKDGYQTAMQYLHSGVEEGTFGNILLGGVIGWGIDSADGADNRYPDTAMVMLMPTPGANQTSTTKSTAAVQPGVSVSVGCKLKDGTVTALTTSECAAQGGASF